MGEALARSPSFYFGTIIFFVGVLLIAGGVSRLIAQVFDFLAFAELISGIVLAMVGYRATRSVSR
jgi:divalent metal cation (Fe/Co/Zn/Cd) transporter